MHNKETILEKTKKSLQWQENVNIELNFAQSSAPSIPYLPIRLASSNSSSRQGLEEQTLLFHELFAEKDLKNSSLETQHQQRRESSTPLCNKNEQGQSKSVGQSRTKPKRDCQSLLIFWSADFRFVTQL